MKKLIFILGALLLAATLFAQAPYYSQPVTFYATKAAAGATGVETAITLTRSTGISPTTTGASFVIGQAKKRYRITSIVIGVMGNATGTAEDTTFSLRVNPAGAVTTSSTPVVWQGHLSTTGTSNVYQSQIYVPQMDIYGDGTAQIGVTANSVFTTNAPTWDVTVSGFEY
jgi:hypothetical protein